MKDKKNTLRKTALALAVLLLIPAFGCTPDGGHIQDIKDYIHINEVMAVNTAYLPIDEKNYGWIELHNSGTEPLDLSDYYLSNNQKKPFKMSLAGITLTPGEYRVIFTSGFGVTDDDGTVHAPFKLSGKGGTLLISKSGGDVAGEFSYPAGQPNISFGRDEDDGGSGVWFAQPTPGEKNGGPTATDIKDLMIPECEVMVSEVMAKNTFTLPDEGGEYHGWIELTNLSDIPADLGGYTLSDNVNKPGKWVFPAGTEIPPQGCLIVFCSKKDRRDPAAALHTSFGVSAKDSSITLYSRQGNVVSQLALPAEDIPSDVSYGYPADSDTPAYFSFPTPGAPNTQPTALPGQELSAINENGVIISEVMAVSSSRREYKEDFIEIYNSSSLAVSLLGYTLRSASGKVFYTFPDISIGAGEYKVVWCVKIPKDETRLEAAKTLKAGGELLLLIGADGRAVDQFDTGKQVYGVSSGRRGGDRSGRVLFAAPTPGEPNSGQTYSGFAPTPSISLQGGYVDPETVVTIEIPEGFEVRYTLNGEDPDPVNNTNTKSRAKVYEPGQEIVIKKTAVLRARAFREGYLPSDQVSETYFIEEPHKLPIVSLSSDPYGLFDIKAGIMVEGPGWAVSDTAPHTHANYYKDHIENACHVEYYGVDGAKAVEFNAETRVFGNMSREFVQRSLRLKIREADGLGSVTYPFFNDYDFATFGELAIRAGGQDLYWSKMRDTLAQRILKGQMELDIQESTPCAVYINGNYWGLYFLLERFGADYLERKYGFEPGCYDLIKGQVAAQQGNIDSWSALNKYCETNDLKIKENYEYVCSQVDIESLILFWVAETYFANQDTGGNNRCYRSYDNGKWRWMIFDLDGAFRPNTWWNNWITSYLLDERGHGIGHGRSNVLIRKLLENPDFRDEFISIYCHHINSTFASERTLAIFDRLEEEVADEMSRQIVRWGLPNRRIYQDEIALIRECLSEAPEKKTQQLKDAFHLTDAQMAEYLKNNP